MLEQPSLAAKSVTQTTGAARPRVLVAARWPVGGVRTHLLTNYKALSRAGFRFTFVGPADASLDGLRDGFGDVEGADFLGAPIENRRCRLWPLLRSLLRQGRFGLLHSHGATAAAHAALANLGVNVPHVITMHQPLRLHQFSGWLGRLKRWTLGHALALADAVLTAGDDARTNLLEYFPALCGRADRVRAMSHGIAVEYASATREEAADNLRQRLGLDAQPFLFGFVGRFLPEKGFPVLLDAVERLTRMETVRPFHLAGFGCGDFRHQYQKAILRRGLDGFVSLLDSVADVRPILRQLDLLVVPSLWETSSPLAMEAMTVGVPVLGSDCLGLREVLRDTPSRTVAPNDAAALAAALRSALEQPWTEAARAFAPQARRRFDNASTVRRLTALFDSLTVEAQPSGAAQAA